MELTAMKNWIKGYEGEYKKLAADICFYLGLLCELAVSFSGYAYGNYKEPIIIVAGMGFFAIAILLQMDLKRDWLVFLLCGCFGLLCYYFQGSALILRILLLLLAGRNKNAKAVMRVYCIGTLAVMLITGLLSAYGFHNELVLIQNYRNEVEARYCFGFFNPNGFAVFAFKELVVALYAFGDRLKWWGNFLITLATVPFMLLANSKTGLLALGVVVLYLLIFALVKNQKIRTSVIYISGNLVMFTELAMIYLVLKKMKYLRTWEIGGWNLWKVIDNLTTGRLQAARALYLETKPTLWGVKSIEGATEVGFFNSLYHEGIVFVTIYIVLLFVFFYRLYKQQDYLGMLLVVTMTIYCMGEAFLPYANKNAIYMVMIGNLPILNGFIKQKRE